MRSITEAAATVDFDEHPLHVTRHAWRDAVNEIAAKAHDKLPECNGRVDSAVKLVLAGDVELLADGSAHVASQSPGQAGYHVLHGERPCKDFAKAPHHFCKHRLSVAITKRANALLDASLSTAVDSTRVQADITAAVEPADESVTIPSHIPTQYIVTLHGKSFVQYAGLLVLAHARGLVSLKVHFISVTDTLALAAAEAIFADGTTYSECADATPANVGATVKAHFPRIALTRAKARALRDALNIGLGSLEELSE